MLQRVVDRQHLGAVRRPAVDQLDHPGGGELVAGPEQLGGVAQRAVGQRRARLTAARAGLRHGDVEQVDRPRLGRGGSVYGVSRVSAASRAETRPGAVARVEGRGQLASDALEVGDRGVQRQPGDHRGRHPVTPTGPQHPTDHGGAAHPVVVVEPRRRRGPPSSGDHALDQAYGAPRRGWPAPGTSRGRPSRRPGGVVGDQQPARRGGRPRPRRPGRASSPSRRPRRRSGAARGRSRGGPPAGRAARSSAALVVTGLGQEPRIVGDVADLAVGQVVARALAARSAATARAPPARRRRGPAGRGTWRRGSARPPRRGSGARCRRRSAARPAAGCRLERRVRFIANRHSHRISKRWRSLSRRDWSGTGSARAATSSAQRAEQPGDVRQLALARASGVVRRDEVDPGLHDQGVARPSSSACASARSEVETCSSPGGSASATRSACSTSATLGIGDGS